MELVTGDEHLANQFRLAVQNCSPNLHAAAGESQYPLLHPLLQVQLNPLHPIRKLARMWLLRHRLKKFIANKGLAEMRHRITEMECVRQEIVHITKTSRHCQVQMKWTLKALKEHFLEWRGAAADPHGWRLHCLDMTVMVLEQFIANRLLKFHADLVAAVKSGAGLHHVYNKWDSADRTESTLAYLCYSLVVGETISSQAKANQQFKAFVTELQQSSPAINGTKMSFQSLRFSTLQRMVSHRMLAESMHELQTKGLRRSQSGSSAPQTVWSPIIDSLLAVEWAVDSRFAGFQRLWNVLKSLEGLVSNLVVPYTRVMVGSILADGSIGGQQVIRILLLLSDVILVLKPLEVKTKKFQVLEEYSMSKQEISSLMAETSQMVSWMQGLGLPPYRGVLHCNPKWPPKYDEAASATIAAENMQSGGFEQTLGHASLDLSRGKLEPKESEWLCR